MKRLSRHTVVALLTTLVACASGLGLAVVASGQTTSDPTSDYTVPLGDYTTTTPSTVTTQAPPAPQAPAPAAPERTATVPAASGRVPRGRHVLPTTTRSVTPVPSKTTRSGPTTLAFTGGEPIILGAAGVALMLGGLVLQRRRRRAARLQA
jgi:LPXTG-motif cell wall-anchored protein